jgi:hypothetical protein
MNQHIIDATNFVKPVAESGEAFLSAIEHLGARAGSMSLHEHRDLLDETTEWLIRAQCAQNLIEKHYDARIAKGVAGSGNAGGEPPGESFPPDSEQPPLSPQSLVLS